MNKRQMKKLISKNSEYCYEIISNNGEGTIITKTCPNLKVIGTVDKVRIDSQGVEQRYKSDVLYCAYAKVSSEEDYLFADLIKCCNEKLPKYIEVERIGTLNACT